MVVRDVDRYVARVAGRRLLHASLLLRAGSQSRAGDSRCVSFGDSTACRGGAVRVSQRHDVARESAAVVAPLPPGVLAAGCRHGLDTGAGVGIQGPVGRCGGVHDVCRGASYSGAGGARQVALLDAPVSGRGAAGAVGVCLKVLKRIRIRLLSGLSFFAAPMEPREPQPRPGGGSLSLSPQAALAMHLK